MNNTNLAVNHQHETDRHILINVLEYVTCNSTATRKKVGAIIIDTINCKPHLNYEVVSNAFNSVPRTVLDKSCENEQGETKKEVIHAEALAIAKAAKKGVKLEGTTLYCTIPPCPVCCGLIIEAGIKRVVYKEEYWSASNTDLLIKAGITVEKFVDTL